VVVVGFFALSGSKLEYYALPAFPALALMVGGRWGEALGGSASAPGLSSWLAVSAVGGGVVGLACVIGSSVLTPGLVHAGLAELNVYYRILKAQGLPFPFFSIEPFAALVFWLGLALLLGLPGAFALFHLRRPRASFAALLGLAASVAILVFQLLLIIEPHHSSKALAQAVSARVGERDLLAHEGSLEYSAGLPFYTGRRVHVVNGRRGDLDFGGRFPEANGYFLDGRELGALWNGATRVFLAVPGAPERSVLASLPPERVHLLGRYGTRRLFSNQGD
jgi:4-amino-4-deoxy-L-arabinose transferase-like glycosyltransferase